MSKKESAFAKVFNPIMDRLAEEVGSRPRVAVYIMLGMTLALLVSVFA